MGYISSLIPRNCVILKQYRKLVNRGVDIDLLETIMAAGLCLREIGVDFAPPRAASLLPLFG